MNSFSLWSSQLNIDQDKSIMSSLTGTPTEASFAKAKKVYEFGAESGSYAVLNIGRPWMQFWAGTEVTGTSMTGSTIKGKLLKNTGMLSTQLLVAYAVESSQEPCYVGGLPSQYQVSAGCK